MLVKNKRNLTKGNLLKIFSKMSREFEVKFEIFPLALPVNWASAVHISIGNNIGRHGDRIPALFLNKDRFWTTCSSIENNHNNCHNFRNVSLNVWTSFKIWQARIPDGDYIYEYSVNNNKMYSVVNSQPKSFQNINVYAADPWHDPVNGSIRNLEVCI